MRDAPSLVLSSRLLAEGANVRAWDPVADAEHLLYGVTFCDSYLEAVQGADAALIVTEGTELAGFLAPEVRDAMSNPLIVDGRNLLDPGAARAAGFAYEGVGRPSAASEPAETPAPDAVPQ
jgi:UDPglucose 6-dehydrogenase